MKRINRAENWERVHQAFQQINFAAWDFNTVRESLVDYLKLYFPEDFNDFIESSELVEYINLFAYTVELLAYRIDLNSNENFRTTAQRKESILRIAKLLSYNSSRNLPARGLVKITSISTTERVFDSRGTDLTNRTIRWSDPTNPNWKEQFLIVINRILSQDFGTVLPSDRVQVQDALMEVYNISNINSPSPVSKFNITVSGNTYPMEIVSTGLNENGPFERRPVRGGNINILFLSDGLGDSSQNTGFFFFTKQGALERVTKTFDGITPNQFVELDQRNCNEIDIWVNNINPDTGNILTGGLNTIDGEWERVDVANSQNIIFNTNPNRKKFEVETLADDRVRLLFGDGNFSDIPSGTFDIWVRTSANEDLVIPTTAIQNKSVSLAYRGSDNRVQSFKFSFSLLEPIDNAVSSESIESIRNTASSVYYTQDRMVNNVDYNTFMLQDNSILKLRSVNRTFSGDSKYLYWKDPREYYENVKIFGDDLVVYFEENLVFNRISGASLPQPDQAANANLVNALINNHIRTIFDETRWFTTLVLRDINPLFIRKTFTLDETNLLASTLSNMSNNRPETVYLLFSTNEFTGSWSVLVQNSPPQTWHLQITSLADGSWEISYISRELVVYSKEVNFWLSNRSPVLEYDSLNRRFDNIVILKANNGVDGCSLDNNKVLRVIEPLFIDTGEHLGLQSIKFLSVLPEVTNQTGLPDDVALSYLIPNIQNPTDSDFIYFYRENVDAYWEYLPTNSETIIRYNNRSQNDDALWKRRLGVSGINFLWLHRTPRYHLIDPAATNIIDTYVLTRDYFINYRNWLNGRISKEPLAPTPLRLKSSYAYLLESKMISDTIVLHPAKIKPIIGDKAPDSLKGKFKFVRSQNATMTNNEIKVEILDIVNNYFDITKMEFGESFFFTELASAIHDKLFDQIDSIVLVPSSPKNEFGDLMQVNAREDEIIQPSIKISDIEVATALSPSVLAP